MINKNLIQSGLNGHPTFPLRVRLFRMLWIIVWISLGAWTPPTMRGWRRFLLRSFGAKIHSTAVVRGSAKIWYPPNLKLGARSCIGPGVKCYNIDVIDINEDVIISQNAFLCTASHDINRIDFLLISKPIKIESKVWIAADAFVGPGVIVREGAVLGARAATFKDLDPWTVYRGNPAKPIKERSSSNFKRNFEF